MNKKVYGFKVKISQLSLEHQYKNYGTILTRLSEKGWKFVYLKRENFIRHKLSNILTVETNVFHVKENEKAISKKIKVDCDLLMKAIKFGEEIEKKEEQDLRHIPHLKLTYEQDILQNEVHQATANKVFDFIELSHFPVRTIYKRITPLKLEDSILNYTEVFNYFKDSEYSHMLR